MPSKKFELDKTWMADPARRDVLQRYVDDLTAQRWRDSRNQNHSDIRAAGAMHRLEDLCGDLERAWRSGSWFQATSACVLLAELLTASVRGGIFDVSHLRAGDVAPIAELLLTMRNVCCHPGCLAPGKKEELHVRLLAVLAERRNEHGLADRLRRDHGTVRSRELAAFAVRMLNAFGEILVVTRPALRKG